jgi:hypothetical protein
MRGMRRERKRKREGITYVLRYISNRSKHPQYIQKPTVIVLPFEWPAAVSFWERFEDFGGDELRAEKWAFGGHCNVWVFPKGLRNSLRKVGEAVRGLQVCN